MTLLSYTGQPRLETLIDSQWRLNTYKMFELNENITIKESVVEDSPIYAIDDFYKNPEEILTFLLENETEFHKKNSSPLLIQFILKINDTSFSAVK